MENFAEKQKFPDQEIRWNYGILSSEMKDLKHQTNRNSVSLHFFCECFLLTHFKPMFHFHTPWKHQKTWGSLMFSGGIVIEHWLGIGCDCPYVPSLLSFITSVPLFPNTFLALCILYFTERNLKISWNFKIYLQTTKDMVSQQREKNTQIWTIRK